MKRTAYLFACYVVGLILGGFSVAAFAQESCSGGTCTAPATPQTSTAGYASIFGSGGTFPNGYSFGVTPFDACENYATNNNWTNWHATLWTGGSCIWSYQYGGTRNGIYVAAYQCGSAITSTSQACGYTCPTTGGWTLSGSSCTRPECGTGTTRDEATGQCISQCTSKAGQEEKAWYTFQKGSAPWGQRCSGGCEVMVTGPIIDEQNPNGEFYYEDQTYTYRGKEQFTGGACTAGDGQGGTLPTAPEPNPGPETAHEPQCAANEGVMTTSTGKVFCVPEATPGSDAPSVTREKKVEKFPDGSTRTTETIKTTDTRTEVTHTSVTVTRTASSSGGTGSAGEPGSSTSTSDSSKDTDGDGLGDSKGDCDPTKDMCSKPGTGGLYTKKTKTFQTVVQTFSNGVSGSPMGQAAGGFFNVTTPGGACPNMMFSVDYLDVTLNLADHFCSATAIQWMDVAGAVLLALASFLAFTWAFL